MRFWKPPNQLKEETLDTVGSTIQSSKWSTTRRRMRRKQTMEKGFEWKKWDTTIGDPSFRKGSHETQPSILSIFKSIHLLFFILQIYENKSNMYLLGIWNISILKVWSCVHWSLISFSLSASLFHWRQPKLKSFQLKSLKYQKKRKNMFFFI